MDQQNSTTSTTTPTPSTSQPPSEPPSQPPLQSQPQSQPQPQPPPPSSSTTPSTSSPNPNPKPSIPLPLQPQQHQQQPQPQPLPSPSHPRPPSTLTRPPWPQSNFAHFPSLSSSASSGPPPPSSVSTPPPPRGGIAIGVPAHHPSPSPPQPTPFSSSYGQHFGGLGRGGVTVPEPATNSNASQVRPSIQGMQGMGMMGSLGSSSQMRSAGVSAQHPQRPVQSSFRPPSTASGQSTSSQNFQGHSLLRVPSVGTVGSSPNTSQGLQPHTQPWLSSGSQGKPPIPSPAYRHQLNSQTMPQRSHLPAQQHHSLPTASQPLNHPLPSASQQQSHPLPPASQQQSHPLPTASQQQSHPLPSASQQHHTSLAHQQHMSSAQQQHTSLAQQQHMSSTQQQHMSSPQQQHMSSAQHQHMSSAQHQHISSAQQQHMSSAPQQHMSAAQQHNMTSAQQQQSSSSNQGHEQFGQQVQPSRVPQTTPCQQQITRVQGHQKSSTLAAVQPSTVPSGPPQNKTASAETDESCNRILSKRSIHELVNQIDPSERLDPEVEDILMDIADEFVDSITTFSCSLAKHRKSNTLEAKDILLHIEKNWNITLPGFGGDEIKGFRKPLTNDIHKERLAVIKKSIVATETTNARTSTGQATGNAKGSVVKTPANIISSQNVKMREVT